VVEEGAVVNGVVVIAPAPVSDYVFINNGWYYWHPGLRCWVHARRPEGWRPAAGVHVYSTWREHPIYRTAVVVARPAAVVVAQPAPVIVEEGAMVGGVVVVAPALVSDYVSIGGGWYYWHPGLRCWVHAHRSRDWHPAASAHIYHSWGEHPMYGHR
jgi:hypothetical protein